MSLNRKLARPFKEDLIKEAFSLYKGAQLHKNFIGSYINISKMLHS